MPCWLSHRLRSKKMVVHAPLVDGWGGVDGAGSQGAGLVELYRGLRDMVALLGSKFSVFSCCVLHNRKKEKSLSAHSYWLSASTDTRSPSLHT